LLQFVRCCGESLWNRSHRSLAIPSDATVVGSTYLKDGSNPRNAYCCEGTLR